LLGLPTSGLFLTGLNIAGDVVQGRNSKQAAKSRLISTEENLLQKAMDSVGPPLSYHNDEVVSF
jgi:hypothetical protein